jgi:hypothetical protein
MGKISMRTLAPTPSYCHSIILLFPQQTHSCREDWRRKIHDDILRLLDEAKERDIPITSQTIRNTRDMVDALPDHLMFAPGLGLEQDGGMLLEWYDPALSQKIFSVIIRDKTIVYALLNEDGMLGNNGVAQYSEETKSLIANIYLKKHFIRDPAYGHRAVC